MNMELVDIRDHLPVDAMDIMRMLFGKGNVVKDFKLIGNNRGYSMTLHINHPENAHWSPQCVTPMTNKSSHSASKRDYYRRQTLTSNRNRCPSLPMPQDNIQDLLDHKEAHESVVENTESFPSVETKPSDTVDIKTKYCEGDAGNRYEDTIEQHSANKEEESLVELKDGESKPFIKTKAYGAVFMAHNVLK